MKLLLHICCAPCSTATIESWRHDGAEVAGVFYNPNIHPFDEHQLRYDTLTAYAGKIGMPLVGNSLFDMDDWLLQVSGHTDKGERCRICIAQRMGHSARLAAAQGFDAFSTTLLISPWQEHGIIMEEADKAAAAAGVEFVYRDLRPEYRKSRELSKEADLYRQDYCGCVFSEGEAALARVLRAKKSR